MITALFFSQYAWSITISQCIQADGTIEFTNQGCSQSYIKNTHTSRHISKRKQKLFRQKDFIKLQSQLLQAHNLSEMERLSRTIMYKVNEHAQKGNLRAAYNMIAATYAKLAKEHKKKHWEGKPVPQHSLKIQELFENVLITQPTTSRPEEIPPDYPECLESTAEQYLVQPE